jgi:hypothetical protein
MSNGSPEDNLKQIFRVFDINQDGSISTKELKRIVKDLFHLLSKEDNPEAESQEVLADKAFRVSFRIRPFFERRLISGKCAWVKRKFAVFS